MSTEKPAVPQSTPQDTHGARLGAREALRAGLECARLPRACLLSGSETAESGSGLFPALSSGDSDGMDSDRIQESNRIPADRDGSRAALSEPDAEGPARLQRAVWSGDRGRSPVRKQ